MNISDYIDFTKNHIRIVDSILNMFCRELELRGKTHDYTKLISPEVEVFSKNIDNRLDVEFGSLEYTENLNKINNALIHHYLLNSHHPEHFSDGILGMNLIDLLEFIADCKASTLINSNDDLLKSIDILQDRFNFSDDIKSLLVNTAYLLYKYVFICESINDNSTYVYMADDILSLKSKVENDLALDTISKNICLNWINSISDSSSSNNVINELYLKFIFNNTLASNLLNIR